MHLINILENRPISYAGIMLNAYRARNYPGIIGASLLSKHSWAVMAITMHMHDFSFTLLYTT